MKQYTTENKSEKPVPEHDFSESDFSRREVKPLKPGLYLVATPIGNLRDISLRALEVLRGVDFILCEDTRVTRKLLNAYQIEVKTHAYHDHSDDTMRDKIVGWLQEGKKLALVSDAGMPLISDPGYKLVQACAQNNLPVTTIPGANAPLSALQLSGLPSDKFCFLGFFPNKTKARQDLLREWIRVPATLLAFETAPRLVAALTDIEAVFGDRQVAVVREITKMFEEVRRGTPAELLLYYNEKGQPKGEIVMVIAAPEQETFSEADIEEQLRAALKTMKTKDAAAHVSNLTGVTKSEVYTLALGILKNVD